MQQTAVVDTALMDLVDAYFSDIVIVEDGDEELVDDVRNGDAAARSVYRSARYGYALSSTFVAEQLRAAIQQWNAVEQYSKYARSVDHLSDITF